MLGTELCELWSLFCYSFPCLSLALAPVSGAHRLLQPMGNQVHISPLQLSSCHFNYMSKNTRCVTVGAVLCRFGSYQNMKTGNYF